MTAEHAPLERGSKQFYAIKCKPLPSKDEILRNYVFDDQTGLFWLRRKDGFASKYEGSIAAGSSGHRQLLVNRQYYMVHRLVWKLVMGDDPVGVIDHVNGIRDDNRITNLRDVSPLENAKNMVRGRWKRVLDDRIEAIQARKEERERAQLARLKARYEP